MPTRAETQGDFALRRTGSYFDMIIGPGYHLQPITFNEFQTLEESLFMYDDSFFQIPGYIQHAAEIQDIEEEARLYVVDYIRDEFDHNLLGMQDYVRWAKRFEHRCAEITPSFWAQVNMHDLMFARELEMDETNSTTRNMGNMTRLGGQTTIAEQTGESTTTGKTTSTQDTTTSQDGDSSTREATATVPRANDIIDNNIDYDWAEGADSVHEVKSMAGDMNTHVEGVVDSESKTDSASNSSSTTTMNNSKDENMGESNMQGEYTNKMFMQEKQMAINTAQLLAPLTWLRTQLRPMFYQVY